MNRRGRLRRAAWRYLGAAAPDDDDEALTVVDFVVLVASVLVPLVLLLWLIKLIW